MQIAVNTEIGSGEFFGNKIIASVEPDFPFGSQADIPLTRNELLIFVFNPGLLKLHE